LQTRTGDPRTLAHLTARYCVALVAAGCLSAIPQPALAKAVPLETVDLNDRSMSTEGGLAKLFRLTNSAAGRCKIEVIHYGEMGQTTYRFTFSAKLNYAALREYAYVEPLNARGMTLRREVLLSSREGKRLLPAEFSFYKALFAPAKLAQCAGRK
jgi:hypothetical protein